MITQGQIQSPFGPRMTPRAVRRAAFGHRGSDDRRCRVDEASGSAPEAARPIRRQHDRRGRDPRRPDDDGQRGREPCAPQTRWTDRRPSSASFGVAVQSSLRHLQPCPRRRFRAPIATRCGRRTDAQLVPRDRPSPRQRQQDRVDRSAIREGRAVGAMHLSRNYSAGIGTPWATCKQVCPTDADPGREESSTLRDHIPLHATILAR